MKRRFVFVRSLTQTTKPLSYPYSTSISGPETTFNPTFELKQLFINRKQFRDAIHSHAIMSMRNLKITKNDNRRIYAKCTAEGCNWHINALRVNDESTYQVREYEDKHDCGIDAHCRNVKSRWLARKYEELFRIDPNIDVKGFGIEASGPGNQQVAGKKG